MPPWEKSPQLRSFLIHVVRRSLGILIKWIGDEIEKGNSWQVELYKALYSAACPIAEWIDCHVQHKENT